MSNTSWKKYKLSEITSKLGDGLHGTPKYDVKGDYYFINGNNLENGKIIIKPDTKRVNFSEYQKYKKELNDNTILLSINGTLGNIGYYNNEKVILGKSACYFNLKEDFSKNYIRYTMSTKSFKLFLENYATGATIKNVSLDAMRNFEFYAPNKDLQEKIAKVLSNYDDLIENNNRRIKILEEMAQKIYKEWFVDFKFPGYETATFKDSELGKIPSDWNVGTIKDINDVKGGYAFKSKDLKDIGECGIIKIKNIQTGNIDLSVCQYIDDKISKKAKAFQLKTGDILIAMTGAQVGKVGIMPKTTTKYYLNQRVGMFIPNKKCIINNQYLSIYAQGEKFILQIKNIASGAAQPNISSTQIENIELLIPNEIILEKFEKNIDAFYNECLILKNKNETLKQTRDILLPRLISGEIDVENLEII